MRRFGTCVVFTLSETGKKSTHTPSVDLGLATQVLFLRNVVGDGRGYVCGLGSTRSCAHPELVQQIFGLGYMCHGYVHCGYTLH